MPESRLRTARSAALLLTLSLAITACAPKVDAFDGTMVDMQAPPFSLVDQHGKPFSLAAMRGDEVVLFFGYTHCPDDCPTTMALLARAMRDLSPRERERVRVALVTTDPARDTERALGRFVNAFDPAFLGLTGTNAQLDAVYAAYHVYRAKLAETPRGYLVAHDDTIFLIDPAGNERVDQNASAGVGPVEHDMRALLS